MIHKHITVQVQANASRYKYVFKFFLKVSKEFESFSQMLEGYSIVLGLRPENFFVPIDV